MTSILDTNVFSMMFKQDSRAHGIPWLEVITHAPDPSA